MDSTAQAPREATVRPDEREILRAARIAEIRDGAVVRQQLTQAASYRRLENGMHEISLFDHRAGKFRRFRARTIQAAITRALRFG